MRQFLFRVSVALLVLLGTRPAFGGSAQILRPWSVKTSLELRYFTGFENPTPGSTASERVLFSPDQTRFAVMLRSANADEDVNIYQLRVYDLKTSLDSLQRGKVPTYVEAVVRTKVTDADDRGVGISSARWSSDSKALTFIAASEDETGLPVRIQRLDVVSGVVTQLAASDTRITEYATSGTSVVYKTLTKMAPATFIYPLTYATFTDVGAIERLNIQRVGPPGSFLKAAGYPLIQEQSTYSRWSLSPDGITALGFRVNRKSAKLFSQFVRLVDMQNGRHCGEFFLAEGGAQDAARFRDVQVRWDDSGRNAVLFEAAGKDIKYIDISHATISEIAWPSEIKVVQTMEPGSILLLESGDSATYYDPVRKRFLDLRTGKRTLESSIPRVYIKEDANTPARLMVEAEGREYVLIDQDPVLNNVSRATIEEVHWEYDGRKSVGGLMLPVNGVGPFPVVIQAYKYVPDRFLPDGYSSSCYAAQLSAAAGVAVLQIDLPEPGLDEWERVVSQIDAVVAKLSAEGKVDPTRVALSGFSRGGHVVQNSLVRMGKTQYRAAVCIDNLVDDFVSYLDDALYIPQRRVFEGHKGGIFWNNREWWMDNDFTMNCNKVKTPVLWGLHGAVAQKLSQLMGSLASMRINRRPYELFYIASGAHALVRPQERKAELEIIVDWLKFWLKDEIPSDPERAARWAVLRKQQDEVLKTPPPPRGHWTFVPDAVQPEWHPPTEAKPAADSETSSVPEAPKEKAPTPTPK